MRPDGKKVLIVDDSAAIRQELREEFANQGFSVCGEAENGRQAIDEARSKNPNLIILDLSMPVMNGLDSAPVLREILPRTPIILYTAFADALLAVDVSATGITKTFANRKPLSELIAVARELLQTNAGNSDAQRH